MTHRKPYKPSALETWGLRYFEMLSKTRHALAADDAIHVLNAEAREAIRRIDRDEGLRACLAGAVSALLCATADSWARPLLQADLSAESLTLGGAPLKFWIIVGGVTVGASLLEILFLHWDALRSVHALSVAAGISLFQ